MEQSHRTSEEDHRNVVLWMFIRFFMKYDRKRFIGKMLDKFETMTIRDIMRNKVAKKLLKRYLRTTYCYDSEAMTLLRCYNISDRLVRDPSLFEDNEITDILLGFCPTSAWRSRLESELEQYRSGLQLGIVLILNDLKRECIFDLEINGDYYRFMREVRDRSSYMKSLLKVIYDEKYGTE